MRENEIRQDALNLLFSVGLSLLLIGVVTSWPLGLDFSATVSDWINMGLKIPFLLTAGCGIVFIGSLIKMPSVISRFIAAIGFYMILYPLLGLVSAVSNISTWLAVGSIVAQGCFSYALADVAIHWIENCRSKVDKG